MPNLTEDTMLGTPRHAAICRALTLAHVDLEHVSAYGLRIARNHIEHDEFHADERGWKIPTRDGCAVTKRRVVRNPNPRLARR